MVAVCADVFDTSGTSSNPAHGSNTKHLAVPGAGSSALKLEMKSEKNRLTVDVNTILLKELLLKRQ